MRIHLLKVPDAKPPGWGKTIVTLIIMLLWLSPVKAQNDSLYFRHFSVDQGLSNRNVSSIIQDSLGFMWYGTGEGLNRYDGYHFIPFKHDPKKKNTLLSDDITCLAVEKSGIIWIGTKMNGLNRYNPYTDVFTDYVHSAKNKGSLSDNRITYIKVDTFHHLIWIGTNSGLNAYNPLNNQFTRYLHAPTNANSISDNHISGITLDSTGVIWIGTSGGGLNRFNFRQNRFFAYRHKQGQQNSIASDMIRDVFLDKQNNLWLATPEGLNVMQMGTHQFKVYKHNPTDKYSIVSNDITSVYQDRYGKIWAGTAKDGLCVFYSKTEKFALYSKEKESPNSLSSNKINTISQGRSGMFWAATQDGGLNAFNPQTLNFNVFNPVNPAHENFYQGMSAVKMTSAGYLVMATSGSGVYVSDGVHPVKKYSGEALNAINFIYEDQRHGVYLSNGKSLFTFNPSTGKAIPLAIPQNLMRRGDTRGLSHPYQINCVTKDRNGMLWIGTREGAIISYGEKTGVGKKYTESSEYTSISGDFSVTCIHADREGKIWAGTFNEGLVEVDALTGQKHTFRKDEKVPHAIGGNHINNIFEDSKGRIWITTLGGGLNVYDRGNTRFNCYTTEEGLSGNSMNSVMEDHQGNLWIGTNYGICRLTFHADTLVQCRIFDLVDGLPTTEFYESLAFQDNNRRMFFSCKKGFISFCPDSLINNKYEPPVILTDFQLSYRSIKPGDSTGILKASISVTNELRLRYDQNAISFEFTAISFINPKKNMYAYMLEGFDKTWTYRNAENRIASYTNLPPGEYTFKVRGSNNDGVWNNKGASVHIVISAPFWKTWWFYLLCLLTFLSIIYLIYYIRLSQVMKLHEIRNNISKDLHDEIGSTLSSISIYSEVIRKMTENKVPEATSILESLGESSRTAIENMSDIVWTVNPNNDGFFNILSRIRIFAGQLLEMKNINLHFQIPEMAEEWKLTMQQRRNIYLIFKESINNIAKYSLASNCYIAVSLSQRNIHVQIRDDGIGFEANAVTMGGNGLINIKQRMDELNGKFDIHSERQKGTILNFDFEI